MSTESQEKIFKCAACGKKHKAFIRPRYSTAVFKHGPDKVNENWVSMKLSFKCPIEKRKQVITVKFRSSLARLLINAEITKVEIWKK